MQIVLVGHGKMGRMVEGLVGEYGLEVAGVIDPHDQVGHDGPESERWGGVDVAIDFSSPDAVVKNVPVLARRGINIVIGTTGWQKDEAAVRQAVVDTGVDIVAAPNFSTSVVLFEAIVARPRPFCPASSSGRGSMRRITTPKKTRRRERR
jgi:4-hydroxy-tetrahydrodipicolinate reductase